MSKQALQKLITDLEQKKYREGEAKGLMSAIQEEQTKALAPVLERITADLAEKAKEAIQQAVSNIKVDIPKIEIPPVEISMPEIPAPQVTVNPPRVNVTVPELRIPETKFPEMKFPERMNVLMEGVDSKRPLPVVMYGLDGKPFQFTVPATATGGKADFFTIKGFSASAFAELLNPDGRLKVELPTGSSGLTDTELRASSVPVAQASGATWSTNVVDAFGSTAVGSVFNADNRLRVSVETGGSGLTDSELRASSVPVAQASDVLWSVQVKEIFGSTATDIVNPDGRLKVELPTGSSGLTDTELRASSVPVEQVSGSAWSVYATGFNASIGATILNGEGLARDTWGATQVGTWNIGTVTGVTNSIAVVNLDRDGNPQAAWLVSDITASIKAALIDSTGVQYSGSNPVPMKLISASGMAGTVAANIGDSSGVGYSGSNPLPIKAVSGVLTSTVTVGDTVSDAADSGSAPVKIGGIARTANPTAVANGDRVSNTYDDLGRQITRNIQVRDLIHTAYVSVTNGTETTLHAAVAGACLDLIMIVGSNNSDAAVSVDIRPVTGGNIINTLCIPANGTAGWTPPVPWPQSEQGNNWTVDGPDETGRTLTFSALFSEEI